MSDPYACFDDLDIDLSVIDSSGLEIAKEIRKGRSKSKILCGGGIIFNNNSKTLVEFSTPLKGKYTEVGLLGRGGFSFVNCMVNKATLEKEAWKYVQANNIEDVEQIVSEIQVLSSIESPFVVKYLGCFLKDKYIVLKLEYCDSLSLRESLDKGTHLPGNLKNNILFSVCKGLMFLHSQGIAHLDLKPSNILLASGLKDVKLSDFGTSRKLEKVHSTEFLPGTFRYFSPERFKNCDLINYFPSDIWSYGLVVFEVAELKFPYATTSGFVEMAAEIELSKEPWEIVSDECIWKDLLLITARKSIAKRAPLRVISQFFSYRTSKRNKKWLTINKVGLSRIKNN